MITPSSTSRAISSSGQAQDVVEHLVVVPIEGGGRGVAALRDGAEDSLHRHAQARACMRVVHLKELVSVLELGIVHEFQRVLGRTCRDSHRLELLHDAVS